MDEGRKRVIGIIAGIIMARNLDRADDLVAAVINVTMRFELF